MASISITKKRITVIGMVLMFAVMAGALMYHRVKAGRFFVLCITGTAEQVAEAIKDGADFKAVDTNGWNAMMWAASNKEHPDVITVLANAGLDINATDRSGLTALMFAAQVSGRSDMIYAMLDAGADPNIRSINGWTALMFAAWRGNPAIIEALLEAGADVGIKDNSENTAYEYALNNPALKGTRTLRKMRPTKKR